MCVEEMEKEARASSPTARMPPDLSIDRDVAISGEMFEYPSVTSGDIPPSLSPPPLRPDSAADEIGWGGSGNIDEEDPHSVSHSDGDEESEISRSITVEDPGAESHEEDVVGGSDSGDISIGDGGILPVAYAVEDLLVATIDSARSSVSLSLMCVEEMEKEARASSPTARMPPDLSIDRDVAISGEMFEYPSVTSGDIPPSLSPPPLRPDSAADEIGWGGSGNIDEEDPHSVSHSDGDEESEISRSITVEDPGAESHEEDVVGGSDSGDISIDEGGILPVAYAVENLLVATTESARSSVSLLFQTAELEEPYPIPERSKLRQSVSLVVVVVTLVTLFALVAVLGLTGKFSQGEIPSLTLRLTLRPTPSPNQRL